MKFTFSSSSKLASIVTPRIKGEQGRILNLFPQNSSQTEAEEDIFPRNSSQTDAEEVIALLLNAGINADLSFSFPASGIVSPPYHFYVRIKSKDFRKVMDCLHEKRIHITR